MNLLKAYCQTDDEKLIGWNTASKQLEKLGILSPAECKQTVDALRAIESEAAADPAMLNEMAGPFASWTDAGVVTLKKRVTTGFDRPTLSYLVVPATGDPDRARRIAAVLADPAARPAIVYAGTRARTEQPPVIATGSDRSRKRRSCHPENPPPKRRSNPGLGSGNLRWWPAATSASTAWSNWEGRTSRSTSPNDRRAGSG